MTSSKEQGTKEFVSSLDNIKGVLPAAEKELKKLSLVVCDKNVPLQKELPVKRCLFPMQSQEFDTKHMDEYMDKEVNFAIKKWNFDFVNEIPLPGNYSYEMIQEDLLPAFYHTKKYIGIGYGKSKKVDHFLLEGTSSGLSSVPNHDGEEIFEAGDNFLKK